MWFQPNKEAYRPELVTQAAVSCQVVLQRPLTLRWEATHQLNHLSHIHVVQTAAAANVGLVTAGADAACSCLLLLLPETLSKSGCRLWPCSRRLQELQNAAESFIQSQLLSPVLCLTACNTQFESACFEHFITASQHQHNHSHT